MRKKLNGIFLFVMLFLSGLALASAQSAHAEMETLLNSETVTLGQLVRLVLDASETLTTADHERAFNFAKENNWLPKNSNIDDLARMDTTALIFLKAFDIKGGLLFSLTGAPHYAYRELVNMNAIQGRTTPNMTVSGEQLLFITSRFLADRENAEEEN